MKNLINWVTENPELVTLIIGSIYEIAIRLWPTEKNRSIIDLIYKVITVILPNRVKDTTKIILLFVMFSIGVSAQTNSTFKAARSYNADSLTVRTEVTGLQLMYGNVGALYYNNQSSKWRVFSDSAWHDLGLGGGGGSTVNFGLYKQIPYVNTSNNNFLYSNKFSWDDNTSVLTAADGVSNAGSQNWTAIFGELHTLGGIFNDGIIAGESHVIGGIAGDNAMFGRNNSLIGAGTKNFNLMFGDANIIEATGAASSNYNIVGGNANYVTSGVNNVAVIATDGVFATESRTLYTGGVNYDGRVTGNITAESVETVQPGNSWTLSDVPGTAYYSLTAPGDIEFGTSTDIIHFSDGTIPSVNRGLNFAAQSTDITGAANGDVWYNSTLGTLRTRNNGVNVSIPAVPAGSTSQIQLNNSGSFGASANFTFNTGTNVLRVSDGTNTNLIGSQGINGSANLNLSSSNGNMILNSSNIVEIVSSGVGSGSSAGAGIWIHPSSSGAVANVKITNNTTAGDIIIDAKEAGGTGSIIMLHLPTSSAGLPSGALWNNSGVLNIVP